MPSIVSSACAGSVPATRLQGRQPKANTERTSFGSRLTRRGSRKLTKISLSIITISAPPSTPTRTRIMC